MLVIVLVCLLAGVATADPDGDGWASRAAVDQPRQAAERRPAIRARVLRV